MSRGLRVCVVVGVLAGCQGREPSPSVAVTPPLEPVRLRAHVSPKAGRWTLSRVAPRSFATGEAVSWEACEPPCVLPEGTAGLYTDPARVTFVDLDGTCYSNGASVPCDFAPPCDGKGMFCAPLAASVNLGAQPGMLADVVVRLEESVPGTVLGCRDDAAHDVGLCAGSGKVDAPGSDLVSLVPGRPELGTLGCSFCYGNRTRAIAAGLPGLQHGLRSGSDATLTTINTTVVTMQLASSADLEVGLVVVQARPSLDAPAVSFVDDGKPVDCARAGTTRVVVRGGGFGPPAACLGEPLLACPLSGPPASGHRLEVAGATGLVEVAETSWSDGEVSGVLPAGMRNAPLRLVTPDGVLVTAEAVNECVHMVGAGGFPAGSGAVSGGELRGHVEIGRWKGNP